MSLTVLNDSFLNKSYKRYKLDSYAETGSRHLSCKRMESGVRLQSTGAPKSKEKLNHTVPNLQEKNVNKSTNTTAVENYSGRLSFKGSKQQAAAKIGGPVMQSIAKNKLVQSFIKMADKNMLVFEAAVSLLYTCALRPLTIMSLPADGKDRKKNKKAAAKSISSGVISYLCALAISLPLKGAMSKIVAHPEKYLTKNARKFYTGSENVETLHNAPMVKTTEKVFQKMFEVAMIPVRAGLTVSLLPVVDKNIISKIYGNSDDQKADFFSTHLYLKGAQMPTDEFKKFREGRK